LVSQWLISTPFMEDLSHKSNQAYPVIITPTGLIMRAHQLHPQVLKPGRVESGAFRSTPAPHMIGTEAHNAARISSF